MTKSNVDHTVVESPIDIFLHIFLLDLISETEQICMPFRNMRTCPNSRKQVMKKLEHQMVTDYQRLLIKFKEIRDFHQRFEWYFGTRSLEY